MCTEFLIASAFFLEGNNVVLKEKVSAGKWICCLVITASQCLLTPFICFCRCIDRNEFD